MKSYLHERSLHWFLTPRYPGHAEGYDHLKIKKSRDSLRVAFTPYTTPGSGPHCAPKQDRTILYPGPAWQMVTPYRIFSAEEWVHTKPQAKVVYLFVLESLGHRSITKKSQEPRIDITDRQHASADRYVALSLILISSPYFLSASLNLNKYKTCFRC